MVEPSGGRPHGRRVPLTPVSSSDAVEGGPPIGSAAWRELVGAGARALGLDPGNAALEAFARHGVEMLHWNRQINMTAITDPRAVAFKHFVDSLAPLPHLPASGRLLDIGSGAGFPGLPLKVVRPALEVALVDAVRKKVGFLGHVIRMLKLEGAQALHLRLDGTSQARGRLGTFDTVISRAVGSVEDLIRLARPLMVPGGRLIAMRGRMPPGGPDLAPAYLPPGAVMTCHTYRLPDSGARRHLICVHFAD